MKFCGQCGREVLEGNRVCSYCGHKLDLQVDLSDTEVEVEKQRILAGGVAPQPVAPARPETPADTPPAGGAPDQNSSSSSTRRRAVRAVGVLALVAGLTSVGWAVWGSADDPMSSDEYKALLSEVSDLEAEVDRLESTIRERNSSVAESKRLLNQLKQGRFSDQ